MILAIDTTGSVCSVAIIVQEKEVIHGDILQEEKIICEKTVDNNMTHSVNLLPVINDILKSSNVSIGQITKIAVSAGPGSFTGIRIGISTAKALAHANNIPIIAVPTLDALAYNVIELMQHDYIVVPIMDARRNQVYTAIYILDGFFERKSDYLTIEINNLIEYVKSFLKNHGYTKCIFVGDGVYVHKEIIEQVGIIADSDFVFQKASSVGVLSKDFNSITYNQLEPIYIRKPQAVRELSPVDIIEYQDYMLDDVYKLLDESLPYFWSKDTLEKDTKSGLTTYFVATKYENKKIVGVIAIMIVGDNGDIINFAVDKDYRGEAIGIRLFKILDNIIKEKDITNLSLEVRENNVIARNFYKKNGFIVTRVRKGYYKHPIPTNALVMTKSLRLLND